MSYGEQKQVFQNNIVSVWVNKYTPDTDENVLSSQLIDVFLGTPCLSDLFYEWWVGKCLLQTTGDDIVQNKYTIRVSRFSFSPLGGRRIPDLNFDHVTVKTMQLTGLVQSFGLV